MKKNRVQEKRAQIAAATKPNIFLDGPESKIQKNKIKLPEKKIEKSNNLNNENKCIINPFLQLKQQNLNNPQNEIQPQRMDIQYNATIMTKNTKQMQMQEENIQPSLSLQQQQNGCREETNLIQNTQNNGNKENQNSMKIFSPIIIARNHQYNNFNFNGGVQINQFQNIQNTDQNNSNLGNFYQSYPNYQNQGVNYPLQHQNLDSYSGFYPPFNQLINNQSLNFNQYQSVTNLCAPLQLEQDSTSLRIKFLENLLGQYNQCQAQILQTFRNFVKYNRYQSCQNNLIADVTENLAVMFSQFLLQQVTSRGFHFCGPDFPKQIFLKFDDWSAIKTKHLQDVSFYQRPYISYFSQRAFGLAEHMVSQFWSNIGKVSLLPKKCFYEKRLDDLLNEARTASRREFAFLDIAYNETKYLINDFLDRCAGLFPIGYGLPQISLARQQFEKYLKSYQPFLSFLIGLRRLDPEGFLPSAMRDYLEAKRADDGYMYLIKEILKSNSEKKVGKNTLKIIEFYRAQGHHEFANELIRSNIKAGRVFE